MISVESSLELYRQDNSEIGGKQSKSRKSWRRRRNHSSKYLQDSRKSTRKHDQLLDINQQMEMVFQDIEGDDFKDEIEKYRH